MQLFWIKQIRPKGGPLKAVPGDKGGAASPCNVFGCFRAGVEPSTRAGAPSAATRIVPEVQHRPPAGGDISLANRRLWGPDAKDPRLQRCGWAAVVVHPGVNCNLTISGISSKLPGPAQTVKRAELYTPSCGPPGEPLRPENSCATSLTTLPTCNGKRRRKRTL